MWIFLPYINLYSKTIWKFYQQAVKTRLFSSEENEQVLDLIIKKVSSINSEQAIFLTVIWLSHNQLWAILKGTASIT